MGSKTTAFLILVLIGAVYHLTRDILQIAGIQNVLTELGYRSHEWCGAYCDYVTVPLELFVITASAIVIRRKRFGVLGIGILFALLVGLFMWLWQ